MKRFLIAAYPRSATRYMSELLILNGIDMKHEEIGNDGTVSWLHISSGKWTETIDIPKFQFNGIFHQVRYPLDVISSAMTIQDDTIDFMLKNLNCIRKRDTRLHQIMLTYILWNELIERQSIMTFKVENIINIFPKLLTILNKTVENPCFDLSKEINTRKEKYTQLTWSDLENCDKPLWGIIKKMSLRYGY